MTPLLPTSFSVSVPKEAKDCRIFFENGHTRLIWDEGTDTAYAPLKGGQAHIPVIHWKNLLLEKEVPFSILGEVTEDSIGFDVSEYVKEVNEAYGHLWSEGVALTNEGVFRSLLSSNGVEIKEGEKLVILKQNI